MVLPSIRKTGGYGARQPVDFLAQSRAQFCGTPQNHPFPADVSVVLERKCWSLTAEAGTAIREYLTARIVHYAQPGDGSCIDSAAAIDAIEPVTLDVALGPHSALDLHALLSTADVLVTVAQKYAGQLRAGAQALYGKPATAALLSAAATEGRQP
jgi:hypothetical protein